jgi:hypothetical protein
MNKSIKINNIKELIQLIENDVITDYCKATEILTVLIRKPIFFLGVKDKTNFINQLIQIETSFKQATEMQLFICESLE